MYVNGPIKRHIRAWRAEHLLNYFFAYKVLYELEMQKPINSRQVPLWSPPKPTMTECMQNIEALFGPDGQFTQVHFRQGLKKCFVETGCAYVEKHCGEKEFKQYTAKRLKGSLSIPPQAGAGLSLVFICFTC